MNKKEIKNILDMVNGNELEELKTFLNKELELATAKELLGDKFVKGSKKWAKMLEKVGKKRPGLNCGYVEDNFQYSIDSKDYYITLPKKQEKYEYPIKTMTSLFNKSNACLEYPQEVTSESLVFSRRDLYEETTNKSCYIYEFKYGNEIVSVDLKNLEVVLDILGGNAKFYTQGVHKPIHVISERGEGVLLPLRVNK